LNTAHFFWPTFVEMARVTKPNGIIYINAPSNPRNLKLLLLRKASGPPAALASAVSRFGPALTVIARSDCTAVTDKSPRAMSETRQR